MENLIIKTNEQIKNQMHFWFLNYYGESIGRFNGTERFTFFDKISEARKLNYLKKIKLLNQELPIFILIINENELIINTTHRFVKLQGDDVMYINYIDFESHNGYKSIGVKLENGISVPIKKDGYLSEFGIKIKNNKVVYWTIPTGKIGFAFWNITKKCSLIGRKYIIDSL